MPAAAKEDCVVQGCTSERVALGLCSRHYARLKRGRTLDEEPVRLKDPRRVVIVIEDAEYDVLQKAAKARHIPTATYIRNLLREAVHG